MINQERYILYKSNYYLKQLSTINSKVYQAPSKDILNSQLF